MQSFQSQTSTKVLTEFHKSCCILSLLNIVPYSSVNLCFYRYKLHLIVVDSSGKSKFLLFDNLAVELIHQPCISLAGPNADEVFSCTSIYLVM